MSKVCTICQMNHLQIDRELVQGKSLAAISRDHRVSAASLQNHFENHVSRQLLQAYRKKETIEGMNLLGEIEELIHHTKHILSEAERKNQHALALKAIAEARGSYELLCKIAVALHEARKDELTLEADNIRQRQEQEYTDKISILTTAELEMLYRLTDKLQSQDKTDIIIPDIIHKFIKRG